MGTEFYGYVRVIVEQEHKRIECRSTLTQEFSLIKLEEDIVDEHWRRDAGKRELQGVCLRLLGLRHLEFLLLVEETITGGEEDVFHTWIDNLFERAVATHTETFVGAVRTHYAHLGRMEFIAIHLIHPALDELDYLRIFKRIDMVVASAVITTGREETTIMGSLEGHAEIVGIGVHGVT